MENYQEKSLGQRLKELRKKMGLTLQELSEKIDRLISTLSNWENDKTFPDADDLVKLSKIYGDVSIDYILTGTEAKNISLHQYKTVTERVLKEIKKTELIMETGQVDQMIKDSKIYKNISIIQLLKILITFLKGEKQVGQDLIKQSNQETYSLLRKLHLQLTESMIDSKGEGNN